MTNTYAQKLDKLEADARKANATNAKTRAKLQGQAKSAKAAIVAAEASRISLATMLREGGSVEPDVWLTAGAQLAMAKESLYGAETATKRLRDTNTDKCIADAVAAILDDQLKGLGIEVISTHVDLRGNDSLHPSKAGTIVVCQNAASAHTDEGYQRTELRSGLFIYWLHTTMHKSLDERAIQKAAAKAGTELELSKTGGFYEPRESDGLIEDTYSVVVHRMNPVGVPELAYLPNADNVKNDTPAFLTSYLRKLSGKVNVAYNHQFKIAYRAAVVDLRDSKLDDNGNMTTRLSITAVLSLHKLQDNGAWLPVDLKTSTPAGRAIEGVEEVKLQRSDVMGTLMPFAGAVIQVDNLKVGRQNVPAGRTGADELESIGIAADVVVQGHVPREVLAAHQGLTVEELDELDDEVAELSA